MTSFRLSLALLVSVSEIVAGQSANEDYPIVGTWRFAYHLVGGWLRTCSQTVRSRLRWRRS
jgi:hypothetical protein